MSIRTRLCPTLLLIVAASVSPVAVQSQAREIRRAIPLAGETYSLTFGPRELGDRIGGEGAADREADSVEAITETKPGRKVEGLGTFTFPLGPFLTDGQGLFLSGAFAGATLKRVGIAGGELKIALSGSYSNIETWDDDASPAPTRDDTDSFRTKLKVTQDGLGGTVIGVIQHTAPVGGQESRELVAGYSFEATPTLEITTNTKFVWEERDDDSGRFDRSLSQAVAAAVSVGSVSEFSVEWEWEENPPQDRVDDGRYDHEGAVTFEHSLNVLTFHATVKAAVKTSSKVELGYTAIIP